MRIETEPRTTEARTFPLICAIEKQPSRQWKVTRKAGAVKDGAVTWHETLQEAVFASVFGMEA
jgi:hypothetical protein